MMISTDTLISITDANQNFSKVTRLVDEKGVAVIMKNNAPKYIVIEFSNIQDRTETAEKAAASVAKNLLNNKK